MRSYLLIFLLLVQAAPALAFDPYSMYSAGSSILKVAGGLFGGLDEATSSASAIEELYSEVDSSASVSESSQKLIDEVNRINDLNTEIGYSSEDLQSSAGDLSSAKKFSETVKGITSAIRSAKKTAGIFGGLQKRSQAASIESANIEREQLNVQLEILNQQKLTQLEDSRKELESVARQKRIVTDLNKELQLKGARVIGRTGLLHFPQASVVIEDGIKIAEQVRPYLLSLVLFIFMIRVAFSQFSFSGPEAYGDLIKDVFICFLILAVFPEIIRASFSIPSAIADKIQLTDSSIYGREDVAREIQSMKIPGEGHDSMWKSTALIFIQTIWTGLRYAVFTLTELLYKYIILVMVALTPFVIFMSEMFNFPIGWKLFFITFISINLWPIVWNCFGVLVQLSAHSSSGLSAVAETAVAMCLQFLSPLFIYFLTKSISGGVMGLTSQSASLTSQSLGSVASSVSNSFKSEQSNDRGAGQNQGYKAGGRTSGQNNPNSSSVYGGPGWSVATNGNKSFSPGVGQQGKGVTS